VIQSDSCIDFTHTPLFPVSWFRHSGPPQRRRAHAVHGLWRAQWFRSPGAALKVCPPETGPQGGDGGKVGGAVGVRFLTALWVLNGACTCTGGLFSPRHGPGELRTCSLACRRESSTRPACQTLTQLPDPASSSGHPASAPSSHAAGARSTAMCLDPGAAARAAWWGRWPGWPRTTGSGHQQMLSQSGLWCPSGRGTARRGGNGLWS
jgi:hypothetical protein